jgi:hypothetical protein
MNNHPFDAKHTFKLNRFSDVERYANMNETFVEPETEEYAPRVLAYFKQRFPILIFTCRSTFVLGWQTLRAGTSTSYIVARKSKYTGMENPHNVN